MKPTNEPLSITEQIARGLIEGVMTVCGLIVLVFPLALWAVPQHGPFANTVLYVVLSIGSGSLVGIIALAYLKGLLFPDVVPVGAPTGGKARLDAYLTWEQTQDDARRFQRQLRTIKGGALHDFAYMARIATFIGTTVTIMYLGMWAFMDFYYGSTKVMSSEAKYEQRHPDPWGWKY